MKGSTSVDEQDTIIPLVNLGVLAFPAMVSCGCGCTNAPVIVVHLIVGAVRVPLIVQVDL